MPRSLFALSAAVALAASALAVDAAFYSNGGGLADPENPFLETGVTTLSGVPAPPNFVWSECPNDSPNSANIQAGFSVNRTGASGAFRIADDFTVLPGELFDLDLISVYAYQTSANPDINPFTNVNLRIWQGRPGDPQATLVYGDADTNRLVSSDNTNIYRVFNTIVDPDGPGPLVPPPPGTTRRVRELRLLADVTLGPGTYWLDWQLLPIGSGTAFTPAISIPGQRTQPSWNGRQFIPGSTIPPVPPGWQDAIDPGSPPQALDVLQDFPFLLRGVYIPEPASLGLLALVGLLGRRRWA